MSVYNPGDPQYLGFIDSNGDGISDIGGVNSPIENKSFALLRTNPRLTTNIKVIVDSNELMYLGAFKANKELSKVEFQKYSIKSSGSFASDISKFYKNVPNSLRYEILRKYSDLSVYSDFQNQYETQYQYGATHNSTKLYDEQYRMFAPIWLDKNTPKKFVIYRVEDVDYDEKYSEDLAGQNQRVLDLLNKATIIKTFDLSKNSEIGKYIHKHVNDKGFPSAPITMNFKEREKSFFNGIDIVKGGFASKSEVLDNSYTSVDYPEIFSNEILTKGFYRHGLVCANIMNLEFLFDDNTAEDYKVYRYFGLYVDDIDEGSFGVDNVDSNGFISPNTNSYKTLYNVQETSLSAIDMLIKEEDLRIPTLNYLKDKNGIFYHIKNNVSIEKEYDIPVSTNGSTINEFRGFAKTGKRLTAVSKNSNSKGFIKITIKETPNVNDRFFIGDKSEIEIENNNLGTFTFIADDALPAGTFSSNRFSNKGSHEQIANAISQSIKKVSLIDYKLHVDGKSIIIEDFLDGNRRRQTAFGIFKLNNVDFIEVNDGEKDSVEMDSSILSQWDIITPIAGSSNGELIYVDFKEIGDLQIGEYIKTKKLDKFSKIIEINKDPFDESLWRVILDKAIKLPEDNVFDTYKIYEVVHGKFAAYDFKDFDFDFYSTRNSDIGDLIAVDTYSDDVRIISALDYPTTGTPDQGVDVGMNAIVFYGVDATADIETGEYVVLSTGERLEIFDVYLAIEGTLIEIVPSTPLPTAVTGQWPTVFYNGGVHISENSENIIKEPQDYFTWLSPVISDDPEVEVGNINNEYDRLNENELKDTALISRLVPSICKFHLKDSSNAKNLEYILNTNEAFGINNMSPDISISSNRNVDYLNMEHFHFNQAPEYYLNHEETDLTNHTNISIGQFSNDLSIQSLKSTTFNYFNQRLIFNGYENINNGIGAIIPVSEVDWVDNKLRVNYSKFSGGSGQNDSSTVFRGLRYIFRKRKESDKIEPSEFENTFEVNDYKFATIVNYVDTKNTENSVSYDVIKNDIFKFICVYININVVSNDIKYLDRYNVYELSDITNGGNIINTEIQFEIDFAGSEWGSENQDAILKASNFAILDGTADFEKYITKNSDNGYSWLLFELGGDTWGLKVANVLDKTEIIVKGYPYKWNTGSNTPLPIRLDQAQFSLVGLGTKFTYFASGSNEFANLLEQINAYNFAARFNKYGEITYTTILKDGTEINNQFVLKVENGVSFVKPSIAKPSTDPDRPKAYQLKTGSIGDVITEREDGGYVTILNRMNGNYIPLFNKVVGFTDIHTMYKIPEKTFDERKRLIYNKFNYLGISFESHKERETGFGYIKNYFYHKVNDEDSKGVLKLSQTSDKLPIYPKIGEIAIDKKDINLFKSKYSSDFFNKAYPAGKNELVHGTLSPIEKENFFASTVMKVKDTYDITKYSQTREESIEALDRIKLNNLNETSIHWTEDVDTIYADFYLPKAISNELKEDYIQNQFKTYVEPINSYGDKTSIEDDLDIYIDNNISTRFIIDNISVYGIEQKGFKTEFTSVNDPSSLKLNNYRELTNYAVQGYQGDSLSFRLIYNKKPGYSYKLRVHIKIQA